MIPGIGSLTNSGSMPIDMGGGHAGPSTAKSSDALGGINNGAIFMGGQGPSFVTIALMVCAAGALVWSMTK
ncbi:hypothetical protein [Vibrio mediterranei]|uniref:hypothetical protein n=1 Tax=Vibrio mediterranei TaxID=689 RepID=UPI00148BEAD6|nr:hypothetical protein [Vibrio mediterranei]NOH31385.1 hypothetical protein [Vibrio mediterranei]